MAVLATTESYFINSTISQIKDNNISGSLSLLHFTQQSFSDQYVQNILIPSIVYVCILFVIGVPGNALVTYVYFFKLKRKPFSAFIVALAVFDLINCLITMPTEVALLLNFFVFDHPVICKISRFVTFFMNAASCIVLLGIALTRFKAICCPLAKWKVRAKLTVVASLIVSAFTCWPALFLYGTYTKEIPQLKITLKTCLIDDTYKPTIYPDIHSYYLLGTHVFLDSCFFILYSLIGIRVFKKRNFGSMRRSSRMSTSSQDDESKIKRGNVLRSSSRSMTSTKSFPELKANRVEHSTNQTCSAESLEPFINSGIKLLDINPKRFKSHLECADCDSRSSSNVCLPPSSDECLTLERIKRFNSEKYKSKQNKKGVPLLKGDNTSSNESLKRDLNIIRSPSSKERDLSKRSPSLRGRFIFSSSRSTRTFSTASEPFVHGRSFIASRTAKMLFAVTLLFLLTFLPYCVIVIIRIQNPNFYEQQTDVQTLFFNLFLRSYMLSSALNPVIYNFYNNRFRTECKKVIKTILCFLYKR